MRNCIACILIIVFFLPASITNVNAQDSTRHVNEKGDTLQLGEAVVLGSRSIRQRSNLQTAVPVDLFSSKQLMQTGQSNLAQMLNFSLPSFNASRQLVNETITLRGLDPDQTLILLNGTRYHNMAYLNDGKIRGTLGRGSVANDLNSIPFSAIEKIEVLRDGASAQYGSDAIAGVMNIHLKKSIGKTSVQFQSGQFYKNDGETIGIGLNRGIALGSKGFLNISADFHSRSPTQRGGVYNGTVYYSNATLDDSTIKATQFNRGQVSNAGTTKFSSLGMLVNGGFFTTRTEFFWTVVLNDRQNVFTGSYLFPKNSKLLNPYLYPDGCKPRSIQKILDVSAIVGAKGETKHNWRWEYSSAYGKNGGRYSSENTNNASQYYTLGRNAPTSFYTGTLDYQQLTNDFHFSKELSKRVGGIKLLNFESGIEWRLEHYRIKKGEEAAWTSYDPFERKQGGSQNGLIFRPENEVSESRNILATYVDMESELAAHLLIDLAARYEYYNDYGGNLAAKMALRYRVSDRFSLRGSFSSGFRAPALQQRYFSNTTKISVLSGGTLVPVITGVFRNNSDIAKAFGIPSLGAEKSINLGLGFTSAIFKHMSVTVDAYWIQIRDRVVLSGRFDKATNLDVKRILENYKGIDQVMFLTNAINTRTRGVDIVLNGKWNIQKASLVAMLAANFTRTRLFGEIKTSSQLPPDSLNTNTLFNREEKGKVENGQPNDKIILTLRYKTGKWGFQLNNILFGKTGIVFDSKDLTRDEWFSSKMLTDFSIDYSARPWLTITLGANNIFNVYPERLHNPLNTGEGTLIYAQEASPFGYNGGFYYLSFNINL